MTVLVTGGMGYIGSHTCVELLEQGMDVVVVDNLVNSSAEAGRRVEQITGKPLKFYQMDVRDRAGLDRIFTEQKIDCVIHFAGLKAVGESVHMPLEYYDNNLGSTVTLCEAMRDHGVKQIIFSSSATVYSGDNDMPLYETSRTGSCTNPTAGRSTSASRSCATVLWPTRAGRSCCCATSTPSVRTRAASSARIRAACRTTSCPTSRRRPSAGWNA